MPRFAVTVSSSAVIAVVPTPVAVTPDSFAAVPCRIASAPTENVAVPIVAPSTLKISSALPFTPVIVTAALPRSPVNVTVSSERPTAAVTVVVAILPRFAVTVSSSAVIAVVAAPLPSTIVFPVAFAADVVSVKPASTAV